MVAHAHTTRARAAVLPRCALCLQQTRLHRRFLCALFTIDLLVTDCRQIMGNLSQCAKLKHLQVIAQFFESEPMNLSKSAAHAAGTHQDTQVPSSCTPSQSKLAFNGCFSCAFQVPWRLLRRCWKRWSSEMATCSLTRRCICTCRGNWRNFNPSTLWSWPKLRPSTPNSPLAPPPHPCSGA